MLAGADQFPFQPCCGKAAGVCDCPEASALARQTCAGCRRAFSRAQHLLYKLCTCVTDACPLPHRVSDALPGALPTLVTHSQRSAHHPIRKGASQQRGLAAQPRSPSCQRRRSRAPVPASSGCMNLVWSGLGRTCNEGKRMFQDATIKAPHGGAELWCQACCAGPSTSSDCPEARAARQVACAALRRAFNRAQHFLYNLCTCVTDACPEPHRVLDALPGRAACSPHFAVRKLL